jgi:hypothetical protein
MFDAFKKFIGKTRNTENPRYWYPIATSEMANGISGTFPIGFSPNMCICKLICLHGTCLCVYASVNL